LKIFQYCLIFSILIVSGCGSDSRSFDIYYIQERDLYLRIYDDGEVNKLSCSVNDGYQKDKFFTGKLDSNQLEVRWNNLTYSYFLEAGENDSEYILSEEFDLSDAFNSASTLSPIASPDIFSLEMKGSIPSNCTNTAIDIISVTPDNWAAVSNNTITVNYDYRARSEEDLKIQIAYVNDSLLSHVNTTYGPEVIVEGSSVSNGSLTMPLNTQASSSTALNIYALIYETGSAVNNIVTYDRVDIVNTESSSNESDGSLNTDCLTCIGGSLIIGPFD
jgi:hypothetical protein